MIRLHIAQPLTVGTTVTPPTEQMHYLKRVMRCENGTALTLFDGRGGEYLATLEGEQIRIEKHVAVDRELSIPVDIVQGACRSERIEQALQKGTELGAASFTILSCDRATLKLAGTRRGKRLDRWRQIIIEAAEQSGRTRIPPIRWVDSPSELTDMPSSAVCRVLHPHQAEPWPSARNHLRQAKHLVFAVGPEGGFTPNEIEILAHRGFQPLCFGARIMRSETAAPALLAAVQAIL